MKAKEVLKRYAAGERDFRGVNLRGQSFKGKNLSGVDFSGADIRSTNFSGANLRGANFTGAKCGLQRRWTIILTIISWLMVSLSGLFSVFVNFSVSLIFYSCYSILENHQLESQITGWINLIILVMFLIVTVHMGVFKGVGVGAVAGALAFLITFLEARAGSDAVIAGGVFAGVSGGVLGGAVIVAGAVAVAGAFTVESTFAFVGIFTVTLVFTILFRGTVAVTGAFVGAGIEIYIARRAMKGDPRDAWIRSFAIAFAATGGTSFNSADLTDANFSIAKLKSTDFRKAILTRIRRNALCTPYCEY